MMDAQRQFTDFYLAPGGPVDRLQERLRLMRTDDKRLGPRALLAAAVCWVPLVVLALVAPNRAAEISFFHDLAVHVRCLLVIPLLIIAAGPIGARSRMVVTQFLSSGLVSDDDADHFETVLRRGRRMRDSWLAELVVLAVSVALVYTSIRGVEAESSVFWFEHVTPTGSDLTGAGWWYAVASRLLLVFLLVRWAWRYLIWWWFLGRVARLNLNLTGTHPDGMGGLGFVPFHQAVFGFLGFAVGCAVSAAAANRILYAGVSLMSYRNALIGIVLLGVILGVAPMFVFTPRLVRTKIKNWMSYSRFASAYVWMFEQKWLQKPKPDPEALGSGDIQSLADLGGGFERLVAMRPVAVDRRLIIAFVVACAAPLLPLMLTVMPFKEIMRLMMKAVM
ncbi:MAG TPA: hypothetical protein VFH88_00815 [Candidatus Krumholzibacteria bacterium]|nr:hypothetical protein [Candidatus Krumholzibacteria bacterium]